MENAYARCLDCWTSCWYSYCHRLSRGALCSPYISHIIHMRPVSARHDSSSGSSKFKILTWVSDLSSKQSSSTSGFLWKYAIHCYSQSEGFFSWVVDHDFPHQQNLGLNHSKGKKGKAIACFGKNLWFLGKNLRILFSEGRHIDAQLAFSTRTLSLNLVSATVSGGLWVWEKTTEHGMPGHTGRMVEARFDVIRCGMIQLLSCEHATVEPVSSFKSSAVL